jgi:hypothetical protein
VVRAASKEEEKRRSKVDFSNVSLRIMVTNTSTGKVTLDTRLPANWLGSVATLVPQLVRATSEHASLMFQCMCIVTCSVHSFLHQHTTSSAVPCYTHVFSVEFMGTASFVPSFLPCCCNFCLDMAIDGCGELWQERVTGRANAAGTCAKSAFANGEFL